MEYEKLALRVSAAKAGLKPVSSPVVQGASGVEHRFTLLFSNESSLYGFDFYESVTELEVIKSFTKKYDSGAFVNVVCLSGSVTDAARSLAATYGMQVLSPKAAETFFVFEPVAPQSAFS
jgi:hypothetical protein